MDALWWKILIFRGGDPQLLVEIEALVKFPFKIIENEIRYQE